MSNKSRLENLYQQFFDPNTGEPLFAAKIYVGYPGTDPTIQKNQVQVMYMDEDESMINVAQPVRTNNGGVAVTSLSNGTKFNIYVDEPYISMAIFDHNDVEIYHDYNVAKAVEGAGVLARLGLKVATKEEAEAGTDNVSLMTPAATLASIKKNVEAPASMPIGSIISNAGNVKDPSFLETDGSEVSRAAFPELFAAIGERYGAGNGSTTFNLPLRLEQSLNNLVVIEPYDTSKDEMIINPAFGDIYYKNTDGDFFRKKDGETKKVFTHQQYGRAIENDFPYKFNNNGDIFVETNQKKIIVVKRDSNSFIDYPLDNALYEKGLWDIDEETDELYYISSTYKLYVASLITSPDREVIRSGPVKIVKFIKSKGEVLYNKASDDYNVYAVDISANTEKKITDRARYFLVNKVNGDIFTSDDSYKNPKRYIGGTGTPVNLQGDVSFYMSVIDESTGDLYFRHHINDLYYISRSSAITNKVEMLFEIGDSVYLRPYMKADPKSVFVTFIDHSITEYNILKYNLIKVK